VLSRLLLKSQKNATLKLYVFILSFMFMFYEEEAHNAPHPLFSSLLAVARDKTYYSPFIFGKIVPLMLFMLVRQSTNTLLYSIK